MADEPHSPVHVRVVMPNGAVRFYCPLAPAQHLQVRAEVEAASRIWKGRAAPLFLFALSLIAAATIIWFLALA